MRPFLTPGRLALGLLASVALVGCDSGRSITTPGEATYAVPHDVPPAQATPVEIDDIYSGPPPWSSGVISLDDQYVYVEILDVEQYLNRSAPPSAVRIGDDWETGTPAQQFEILDLNDDGDRDIRLRWSLEQLVDDGNLSAGTTELTVWGVDPGSGDEFTGTADVVVGEPENATLATAAANNGSGGVFMDLTASDPLRVLSFDSPFTGTVGSIAEVEVWTRPGSYVGRDGDPTGWTLRETVEATRAGTNVPAAIVLSEPLALTPGETTAVYLQVVNAGGGLRYTGIGSTPPQTTWSDDHLTLFSDVARVSTVAFGGTRFTPRTFSGNVNYEVITD